jgi:GNAT superfamily N-acetyltransferase
MTISYHRDRPITAAQFIDLLQRSGLAARRPVDDADTIAQMLVHADLLITAWQDDVLIGVARSVTDFAYCCYLSDLAVDRTLQRQAVGRRLIDVTQQQLGPRCTLILLAAPAAVDYYPQIGFTQHPSAWILRPGERVLSTDEG